MTDTPTIPWGGLVKPTTDGLEGLPDSPVPYYAGFKDGLYLHRRLLIGRGAIKQSHWPDNFPTLGSNTGVFRFDADPIPGDLMAQVVSFFKRIYEKYSAEAAVILTMNATTKAWRIFIPTQLVSGGGVNYVFDPAHMGEDQYVVGSIHSHCNMNPFHSGTDTGDTDSNDGLHMTIGHISKDIPDIVAMAAINKTLMHYQPDAFPNLFDYTQIGQHEAPAWWDQYVRPTGSTDKPAGFELYKKFEKPTEVKDEKKAQSRAVTVFHPQKSTMQTVGKGQSGLRIIPSPSSSRLNDDQLARQMMSDWGIPGYGFQIDGETGVYTPRDRDGRPWWAGRTPQALAESGYAWDDHLLTYRWVGGEAASRALAADPNQSNESREFNARQAAERGVKWEKDPDTGDSRVRALDLTEIEKLRKTIFAEDDELFWEDELRETLGDDPVDALFDSDCLHEDDFDWAVLNTEAAIDPASWKELMLAKALGAVTALRALGVDAQLNLKAKPLQNGEQSEWLLPNEPKKSRRQQRREKKTKEATSHGIL